MATIKTLDNIQKVFEEQNRALRSIADTPGLKIAQEQSLIFQKPQALFDIQNSIAQNFRFADEILSVVQEQKVFDFSHEFKGANLLNSIHSEISKLNIEPALSYTRSILRDIAPVLADIKPILADMQPVLNKASTLYNEIQSSMHAVNSIASMELPILSQEFFDTVTSTALFFDQKFNETNLDFGSELPDEIEGDIWRLSDAVQYQRVRNCNTYDTYNTSDVTTTHEPEKKKLTLSEGWGLFFSAASFLVAVVGICGTLKDSKVQTQSTKEIMEFLDKRIPVQSVSAPIVKPIINLEFDTTINLEFNTTTSNEIVLTEPQDSQ